MPEIDQTSFINDQKNIYFRCVEDSNEPIMITDKKGRLIYTNPAWHRVYGYSREEAHGQTPRLLRSRHQDDAFYSQMWSQILNPQIGYWKGRLINRAKDGREVPILLTITPYKDPSAGILGYMAVALDLTEQEKLERQLSMQERLVTIGELTSGLAHEIGTPIGVIRGRAEMLNMDESIGANVRKTLDIIIRQSDRISNLISTLLRFSRSGSQDIQFKPVVLKKAIDEVVLLLQEKIRRRNIQVVVDIPEQLTIKADAQRIEQIGLNLLINSIHAIDAAIKKGHSGPHQLTITAVEKNDQVLVAFSDTGTGIPADLMDKIFAPFFTTKPTGEGTGLGLSIVSRLAHEMNGQIDLDRDYKGGARLVLTIFRWK